MARTKKKLRNTQHTTNLSDSASVTQIFDMQEVDENNCTKYLGYTIDSSLSFRLHTDLVVSKLNSCSGIMRRLRCFLPTEYLHHIFCALGLSHIIYFSQLVTNFHKANFYRLETAYKNAGCSLFNCTRDILISKTWPFLEMIILWYKYKFIFKVINDISAPCLKSSFKEKTYSYSLRNRHKYFISRVNFSRSNKAFEHWSSKLWNLLPRHISEIQNLKTFENLLWPWLQDNHHKVFSLVSMWKFFT